MKRRPLFLASIILFVILFIFLHPPAFRMVLEIHEKLSQFVEPHGGIAEIQCEVHVSYNKPETQKQAHSPDLNSLGPDFPTMVPRQERYKWDDSQVLNAKYKQFSPAMNETEYIMYVNLISTFKRKCETFNITYMLMGGSVLGSYRYHGFVPWDDDFDIQVKSSDKGMLKLALSNVSGYGLYVKDHSYWKFYCENSDVMPTDSWKWPFIDIFFFADTKKYFYDNTFRWPRDFYHRWDIFPLQLVIFENITLPAPRNLETYLSKRYDMQNPCVSNKYDHKRETAISAKRIPCSELYEVYATVHRYTIGDASYEELRLGNKTLYINKR